MKRPKDDALDTLVDQLMASGASPRELLQTNGLLKQLVGRIVERSLTAELTEHLGYEKNGERPATNARNGSSSKTLVTDVGQVEVEIPRDREGTFEPQLVAKHQRRLEGFDEKVLALYGRGMSTREIQGFLEEIYGTEVSPTLISRVTDAVNADVELWRARRLERLYPIVYLDGLVVKIRNEGSVQNRTVYLAIGVNLEGKKEVLGLWMSGSEGAKFWLHVVTELKNRGLEDILIACCDGLKGFPEAIAAVFPQTLVQTCIVHMIRGSLKLVAWSNRKAVAKDLRPIYQAATAEEAWEALQRFDQTWGKLYPSITRSWQSRWELVTPFFAFSPDIRRAIYTTNVIEAVNRQLRKVLKPKGHFPSDEAAMKVLYLAITRATKTWTMPIKRWDLARQQFAIHFEGRLTL